MNKNKPRILIFSTVYFPIVGGAEVAVREITDRLGDWEFDLLTSKMDKNLPDEELIGRVNVYRLGPGIKWLDKILLPLFGFLKAWQLMAKNQYAIIFSLMASQASIAASFFKMLYPDIKLILNIQEGDEEEHLRRYVGGSQLLYKIFIRPWHRLVFRKADLITSISQSLKQRAIDSGATCPIEIVPNGVSLEKLQITNYKLQIDKIKKNLNIKDGEKVIVTTSRLVKKNGIGDLIEAMKYLPPNIKLLVVGAGAQDNYKLQITNYKLDDRVIMLGAIKPEEVPLYLFASDIFVRPSLSEGLGNSFLEAMAAGLPIIGTAVGGIVDFLADEQTGLFCNVNDPASIAVKIKLILDDEELRQRLIANGRGLVQTRYDWANIALQYKEIFNNLIL